LPKPKKIKKIFKINAGNQLSKEVLKPEEPPEKYNKEVGQFEQIFPFNKVSIPLLILGLS
jgi:hypothetical protein